MYSLRAIELRRCHAMKADGTPCHAWAVWGDWHGLCVKHGGKSPYPPKPSPYRGHHPTRYESCRCEAYNFAHRPGGGNCHWPDVPQQRCTTPAGTHDWPRPRSKAHRELVRSLKRSYMMMKRAEALERHMHILALFDRQPSPSEVLDEAIRLLVAEHQANGSQPQE